MNYNNKGFNQLTSRRSRYLLDLLQQHDSIIYTDIDTIWRKDPRPYFTGSFDFWAQIGGLFDGSPHLDGYLPIVCTGFLALQSTPKTKELFNNWYAEMLKYPDRQDQDVFQYVVYQSDVDFRVLPIKYFPCGREYFELMSNDLREQVVLIHNNMIVGKYAKIQRFKEFDLWFKWLPKSKRPRVVSV